MLAHRSFVRVGLTSLLVVTLFCFLSKKVSFHTLLRGQMGEANSHAEEGRKLDTQDQQDLRYAVFGSSVAWGVGLDSRYGSYPYKLSSKVSNFATYSGGPNYPATCTKSLVGDESVFDVIVIDYYLLAPEGALTLAKRLRSRFPNAVIVFAKIWTANMVRRKIPDDVGAYETLELFQNKLLLTSGFDNGSKDLLTAIKNDDAPWIFPSHNDENNVIGQAANSVDGYIYEMDMCNGDAKEFLIKYLDLFDSTAVYGRLTQLGHDYIAAGIQDLVSTTAANSGSSSSSNSTTSAVNPWVNGGDQCDVWFTSGDCDLVFSENYNVVSYDTVQGKFALEIDEPGWFNVTNPFDDSRHLYLSFVSTSRPGIYPRVMLNAAATTTTTTSSSLNGIVIDPVDVQHKFRNGVDAPVTISVGMLPPGETTITVKPIETTTQPFWLVGYALPLDDVTVPDPWKFTPPI